MKINLLTLIFLATFLFSCADKEKEKKQAEAEAAKKEIPAPVNDKIIGIGRIIPEKQIIQFAAPISGILKSVSKKENETISEGEVIALLRNDIESSALAESASKINISAEEVKVAKAAIAEYEVKLDNATKQLKRFKALFEKGAETKVTVENAETECKTLEANINKLKTQIGVAQTQVSSGNSSTAFYKAKLEQTKIKAPCTGKILEWKVQPGEGIIAQQAIAQIAPKGNTIVECEIDESLALKVMLDQEASVSYLGATDVVAKGKVYFLSDYLRKKSMFTEKSGEAEDRRVRVVKILLDNPQGLLLNAKVEVNITKK
jgi:multidrug resistance efflux pump